MSVRRPTAPRRRSVPPGQEGEAAPQQRGAGAAAGVGADGADAGHTVDAGAAAGVGVAAGTGAGADSDSGASAAGWAAQPVNPWRKGGQAGRGRGRRGRDSVRPGTAATSGTTLRPLGAREIGGGRPGGRRLSLRGLGLILVVLVAFAIISPTLRHMVEQQEQLRSVTAELEEARLRTKELERRQRLWEDPDYVRAQARDRLGYVVPGERSFVVVDPETITGKHPVTPQERAAQAARERAANAPWYVNLWESAQTAGTSPVPGEVAEEDVGAPADEITPPPGTEEPSEYPTSMEEKKQ